MFSTKRQYGRSLSFLSKAVVVLCVLIVQTVFGQSPQLENLPVSNEIEAFAAGNPHPWSVRTTSVSGGAVQLSPEVQLKAIFNKPNGGAGVTLRQGPLAKQWLDDEGFTVEVIYRTHTPNLPRNIQAVLRIENPKSPSEKKLISSQMREISDSVAGDNGAGKLRFKFDPQPEIGKEETITGVLIASSDSGEILIQRLALQQLRHVAFQVTNDYRTYLNKLDIRGTTLLPSAKVRIELKDSAGKTSVKNIISNNGTFAMTWENPPLTLARYNTLTAKTGNNLMDVTPSASLFGYAATSDHVWLRVKGKDIVTSPLSRGGERPFIAAGVGYAKDVIIPAQDEAVAAFCKAQGLNTIRLPFYTRFFNNRTHEPIDLDYHMRTFIDPVIQAARRHGLYVILDDHGYFSEKIDEAKAREQQAVGRWNDEGVNEWARRWGKVAAYYKDEPYVLGYELCNEPHDIEPETVRDWYSHALKEIRKVDTRHIVLVGTCDWSHSRALEKTWGSVAKSFDTPHNNIVYAFHDYPEDNHPWIVQKHITQFRDTYNVPVMCTEFGATWWNKDETTCREFQAGMLGLFAKENVGWMIWALSGTKNNPRNATPLPDKIRKEKNIPLLPKSEYDSCAYSDIWVPIARIMASEFPVQQDK